MGLRWLTLNCPNAKAVLNIDDDVFVNIFRVVKVWLPLISQNPNQFLCAHHPKVTERIIRKGGGKWEVDDTLFPGLDYFPFDACSGFFVLYSGQLAKRMLAAARVTPFFWIDDFYMYGLLPVTLGGADFQEIDYQITWYDYEEIDNCLREKGVDCELSVFLEFREHYFYEQRKYKLWSVIEDLFTRPNETSQNSVK